jgi:exonuclease SbcC
VAAAAAALRDTSSAALAADTELRQAREEHARWQAQGARVDELDAAAQPWRRLAELIGGHDGKKFRELAQARTMQALAELANDQLKRFAVRYELRHLPEHPLELLVVDHDAGGEMRATSSLSGGETFLVSLALALALGRLSSRSLHLRTLFVDEGFGSLDSDSVDPVVDALRTLAEGGVQVGLISHVRGIADRLPARVEVLRRGATSELRVVRD